VKKIRKQKTTVAITIHLFSGNSISLDATNSYLNEAIADQRLPIKAHFNILTWSDTRDRAKDVKNMVTAALAKWMPVPGRKLASAAQIFWAGMPGNEADLPMHDTLITFAEQATCFLT